MSRCTVLIGTRANHGTCNLPGDPCSSHAAYQGRLPYQPEDLLTAAEARYGRGRAARPSVPVRGWSDARASIDAGDYGNTARLA